ncbi:hypothetical protein ACI65C_000732 [Semiaphis heraclei]
MNKPPTASAARPGSVGRWPRGCRLLSPAVVPQRSRTRQTPPLLSTDVNDVYTSRHVHNDEAVVRNGPGGAFASPLQCVAAAAAAAAAADSPPRSAVVRYSLFFFLFLLLLLLLLLLFRPPPPYQPTHRCRCDVA